MDKVLLRGQLQTIKNNFALVQAGIGLLSLPDASKLVKTVFDAVQDEPEIDAIEYIQYVFKNDELLKHATNQLRNSVLRNCLKEAYELMNQYGNETGQTTIIKAAPWYQFLRMIRNCLSHDMKLKFRKTDIKHLPVTWGGLTIDKSVN